MRYGLPHGCLTAKIRNHRWATRLEYFSSLQKTSAFLIVDGVDTISQQCRLHLMELLGEFSAKRVDPPGNVLGDNITPPSATPKPKVKIPILGQSKLDDEVLCHFEDAPIRHIAVTEQGTGKTSRNTSRHRWTSPTS